MATELKPFIAGEYAEGVSASEVEDKFSGTPTATVQTVGRHQVEGATRDAADAQASIALTPYRRYEILTRAAALIGQREELFADVLQRETGFSAADIGNEIARAQQTLLLCGEEAKRITGEMVPIDAIPGGSDRWAFTIRHPVGVVAAITPFNSPLNTVLHKIGPAIAAGNAVVLKPAQYTPLTADLILRVLLDSGLPPRLISVLYGSGATVGQWLLEDQTPSFYAFTGSTEVGRRIRDTIGVRRAQLELGSLSSTIVCADTDLDVAAKMCVNAAFRKAGQVCTSVQRLYVSERVARDFADALVLELDKWSSGDTRDPSILVGPVISKHDAERVTGWIHEAVEEGARILHGGQHAGRVVSPTVLTDVNTSMKVMSTELFGPVVSIRPFGDLDDAICEVNDTPYGLSAGILTSDIATAMNAARKLRFGSVHINQTSSSRVDLLPFGGVKASGEGLEGPRYAVHEMTEHRLITIGPGP